MEAVMGLIRELAECFRPGWEALSAAAGVEGPVALVTIEELEARQTEVRARLAEIDQEHAGASFAEDTRTEWNTLNEELERNDELLGELRTRRQRIEEIAGNPRNREEGAEFHTARPGVSRGEDIYDLTTIRAGISNPAEATRELRDRALRSVESAVFPHERADQDRCRTHIERLVERHDNPEDPNAMPGAFARHMLVTGSPAYRRAFGKYVAGRSLSTEEQRALSLGTGSAGGFSVVYTLDPTIIPTSNLSVNPYRSISRVETIVGTNEWRGVSSAGVSATRVTEGTEAADNTPTLAQPAVVVTKAQVFIPFSIEVGQDWGGLQSEMAMLIQDAKDDEEATSFTTGDGVDPNPQGVVTGAATTVAASGVASFAAADIYKTEEALGPRFRPRAVWVSNRFTYNKVRQFDTAGGAQLWMQLERGLDNQVPRGGNTGAQLIGYPAYEASAMAAALTTGSKIAVLGDFRHFLIVDRIGLEVEVVQHLFGTNRRPTGQRGILAYWRNSSKVISANAFRTLVTG